MLDLLGPNNRTVLYVLLGCSLLGAGAGVLGCFAFLRKRSLLGDALAHAALPGVCMAFLLTGTKNPLIILIGATVSCWVGAFAIDAIVRYTRCKEESALGIVLSVFYGIGILLLTHIQKTGDAAQAGLDKFLFGQAAAMVASDVVFLAGVSAVLIGAVVLAYKEFKIVSFDGDFARTLGLGAHWIEIGLATLIVVAVAAGLQAVGVVLMAAMLVTPAAGARYWTDRLGAMLAVAGVFGALSGALGTYMSYLSPQMPTGPWMVVAVTFCFAVSLLFAPHRGVVSRLRRLVRLRRRTARENVLRTLYVLGESRQQWDLAYSAGEIAKRRPMPAGRLEATLLSLKRDGYLVEPQEGMFALTPAGVEVAARLTRLHRLWELYLTRKLELAPDHVHDDAEEIEHIITPDLERRLEVALGYPSEDPHARRIPGGAAQGGTP